MESSEFEKSVDDIGSVFSKFNVFNFNTNLLNFLSLFLNTEANYLIHDK